MAIGVQCESAKPVSRPGPRRSRKQGSGWMSDLGRAMAGKAGGVGLGGDGVGVAGGGSSHGTSSKHQLSPEDEERLEGLQNEVGAHAACHTVRTTRLSPTLHDAQATSLHAAYARLASRRLNTLQANEAAQDLATRTRDELQEARDEMARVEGLMALQSGCVPEGSHASAMLSCCCVAHAACSSTVATQPTRSHTLLTYVFTVLLG